MKVTEVRTYPVRHELGRSLIVAVHTDAGLRGYGEAGLAHWHGAAVEAAVAHLAPLVIGSDPWSTELVWQRMWRGGFFPPGPVYGSAVSAIDVALWDLKGKAAGLPVHRLLGGPVRERVHCYPHARGATTAELVDDCRRLADEGWRFVRWAVTSGEGELFDPRRAVGLALEQAGAVRDALGPHAGLCIDAHTRLDTAHAIDLCRGLEPYRPYFVEDPLRSENPASYATLARHTSVPLAAGEQWAGKWMFREVVEQETIRYARVDVCIAGGLTEALKIAHLCEVHSIDIAPHNPLGPVSAAACVALCMATTNAGVQEMPVRPGSFACAIAPVQIEWSAGSAWCPDVPGLGVEIDEDACAAHRPDDEPGLPPTYARPDGAPTNW